MKRLYFIVVNYNNYSYSVALARSLARQRGLGKWFLLELLVVNNSTNSEDSQELRKGLSVYPWAGVHETHANLGYFGGLNAGLKVMPADQDFVIVGNNDLEFEEHFCASLLDSSYLSSVQVVCPDVVTIDGRHQNPHVVKRTNWFRRLKFDLYFSHYVVACLLSVVSYRIVKKLYVPTVPGFAGEICMGVGACYILLPEFFRKSQSLFFNWFLFGEEACLSWQVRSTGGITWYNPALRVHHAESASCSRLPSRVAYEMGREAYWGYRSLL